MIYALYDIVLDLTLPISPSLRVSQREARCSDADSYVYSSRRSAKKLIRRNISGKNHAIPILSRALKFPKCNMAGALLYVPTELAASSFLQGLQVRLGS